MQAINPLLAIQLVNKATLPPIETPFFMTFFAILLTASGNWQNCCSVGSGSGSGRSCASDSDKWQAFDWKLFAEIELRFIFMQYVLFSIKALCHHHHHHQHQQHHRASMGIILFALIASVSFHISAFPRLLFFSLRHIPLWSSVKLLLVPAPVLISLRRTMRIRNAQPSLRMRDI